eukprot:157081-Amphidinium_carterae.2
MRSNFYTTSLSLEHNSSPNMKSLKRGGKPADTIPQGTCFYVEVDDDLTFERRAKGKLGSRPEL